MALRRSRPLLLLSTLLLASYPVVARPTDAPRRTFQASARFVDGTIGSWSETERPTLARTPTAEDLARAEPKLAAIDFGLSFNCAVEAGGTLEDCRAIYGEPEAEKERLVHALSGSARLTPESAALARRSVYRVTLDVAATTYGSSTSARRCGPPFCFVEGMVPPPPPPRADDPVVAAVVDRADRCFQERWELSRVARFAAGKALRDTPNAGSTHVYRELALAYVRSRQQLAACMSDLQAATRKLPVDAHDAKAVASRLDGMRSNYAGQTR